MGELGEGRQVPLRGSVLTCDLAYKVQKECTSFCRALHRNMNPYITPVVSIFFSIIPISEPPAATSGRASELELSSPGFRVQGLRGKGSRDLGWLNSSCLGFRVLEIYGLGLKGLGV